MHKKPLIPHEAGYVSKVICDLLCGGWHIDSIPEDGKIPRNGLKLILKANGQELRLRICAYKVTTSGRNRPSERRIEITSTYQSGLTRLKGWRDAVLGIDVDTGKYVGVDDRRLNMGGATHNASSFFDLEGLSVRAGELLVNPRPVTSPLFRGGVEQHAFFERSRLAEYLLNQQDIHAGRYTFQGAFSGRVPHVRFAWPNATRLFRATGDAVVLSSGNSRRRSMARVSPELIASVERMDLNTLKRRKLTPAQLKELMSKCDEIGSLGEQTVLAAERQRLRRRGLVEQSNKVERVSLWSVGEGYDILSFENDGVTQRYLEVKTTVGRGTLVEVSSSEWQAARKWGDRYYVVRVIEAMKAPKMFFIQNPADLEKQGKVVRTASGWKVDLRAVMSARC